MSSTTTTTATATPPVAKSTGPYVNQHIPIAESVLRDYGAVTVTIDDETLPMTADSPHVASSSTAAAPMASPAARSAHPGSPYRRIPGGPEDVVDEASPSRPGGGGGPMVVVAETVSLLDDTAKDALEADAPVWRDLSFALLFYLHLVVVLYLGLCVAPDGYDRMTLNFTFVTDDGTYVDVKGIDHISLNVTSSSGSVKGGGDAVSEENVAKVEAFLAESVEYAKVYPQRMVWSLVLPTGLLAFVLALLIALYLYAPFPRTMVYGCLVESFLIMAVTLIWASVVSGSFFLWGVTGLSLAGIMYYVTIAWRMVPFAAVNLKVATKGVTGNCGLFLVAFLFMKLGVTWVVFWAYTAVGVAWNYTATCEDRLHPNSTHSGEVGSMEYDDGSCDPPASAVLFFLLSLYWTVTITMNLIQITVAGVIGTWCYAKDEADHCCSFAIWSSLYRSLTYSFGSVCFGSLLQALVRLFRVIVEHARDQRDRNESCEGCGSLLLCLLECVASLLEDLIYIFNQYAYIYAGIYGTSYLESGRKVMDLFRARGWTTIITNNLVGYVLSYTTFTVGVTTGLIGIALERLVTSHMLDPGDGENYSFAFGPLPYPAAWAFTVAFIMGTWVCAIMMNVMKGAVNTILVCWADSPAVFEMNHPELCREMAESWTSVFPEITVYVRPQATPVYPV